MTGRHDRANNAASWRWRPRRTVSVDVRIFDPVAQMCKYDSGADYVTEYVPELRGVPSTKIVDWPTLSDGEREELARTTTTESLTERRLRARTARVRDRWGSGSRFERVADAVISPVDHHFTGVETADTSSPSARSSRSADPRVIVDVTVSPPSSSMTISAITSSVVTERIVPLRLFRALSAIRISSVGNGNTVVIPGSMAAGLAGRQPV